MKCPKCGVSLLMSEKQGIEIDYCPDCRGIWLDRGELEKIIERTNSIDIDADRKPYYDDDHNRHFKDQHDSHGYKYGRKRNFLSELFD
jgi:uncharacterized protein